jgi:hypothetical protein
MFWWYYRGGRACLFRHKWVVTNLSEERFEVTEACSWCGKRRIRGLLPADEQKLRQSLAYERGRQQRLRIVHEVRYARAKGGSEGQKRALELQHQLHSARRAVVEQVRAERRKRGKADQQIIGELRSQLQGLFFGRQ